jgi:hypothetical protein
MKRKPHVKNPKFIVVASYTGECCECSHVWVKVLSAPSEEVARHKMRALIERNFECGDVVVIQQPLINKVA